MADNSPQDIKTNSFTKKMVTDLHSNFNSLDTWNHAKNALVHSNKGDLFVISNEPSNTLCYKFESTPLSQIQLKDNRLLIIQFNGEFGILNTINCNYEKLFKVECPEIFNFTLKPILGKSRLINNIEEYVVFGNEDIPIGEINLSKIPYKYKINEDEVCKTKEYTKEVDCKELFQFKDINPPCLKISTNNRTGNLPDGAYQIAICYLSGGSKISYYYSLTSPIHIFNDGKQQGAINVDVSNLSRNFEQYQILLIANTNFNGNEPSAVNAENYYTLGAFDTNDTNIIISDIPNQKETIDNIIIQNKVPIKIGNISSNSEYLLYSDIQYSEPIDYQLQAMNIEIEYVIKQVPLEYYKTNFDYGYYGDENYAPAIRWLNNKGEWSYRSHIPGRRKTDKDKALATGDNVYELNKNLPICTTPDKVQEWEVNNTAQRPVFRNKKFVCNERILATGKMGYFESTELYPNNIELFGDDACTNIRYPKFPDETKVPRFSVIDGKIYINLKLWKFLNIEHPKYKNGEFRTDIIGYEILRQSRDNNNKTVKAAGYLSNLRGLQEIDKIIVYQNYPFNDQSPDSFHSLKEVNSKNNKERNFTPLTTVYKNKFSFYTPEANYGLKTSLGQELKILTEERGVVKGNFEEVYNHPEAKLITNFSLYLASLMGIIAAFLEIGGKIKRTQTKTALLVAGKDPGTIISNPGLDNSLVEEIETLYSNVKLSPQDLAKLSTINKVKYFSTKILKPVAATIGFTMLASQHAQIWLDVIQKLVKPRNYAYQYNSVANFTENKLINKRRFVKDYQYIQPSNTQLKDGTIFNNENCNSTIYIDIEGEIPEISYDDTSNNTISGFAICDKPTSQITSSAAMFYAVSKQANKNQYNQLDSGNYVKTHDCHIPVILDKENSLYESPILAGGDCIIVQTSFQNKRNIFSQDISNYQNSAEFVFNYKKYRNLGYPRFWYNNEPYELFNIVNKSPSEGKLPSQTHNLDCRKNNKGVFNVKDEYMYTSVNGVVNYIVETDANLWFRETTDRPHYSQNSNNLSEIFRSDRLRFQEEFKINPAFFKIENNQIFSQQQPLDFDFTKIVTRDKNAIIYSLPATKNQKINNWKTFLPNNYYSFDNLQFGNLTGIHQIDMDRLIFLFDKASPFVSLGQSELQLSNDSITIGDGGLFVRKPRETMHTDVAFGSTESKQAFSSTQFGYFYPSPSQGRLFNFSNKLDDVTKQGMHFWAKEFMPLKLKTYFTEYKEEENTINGVGYTIVFDNTYETIYISKRDFIPIKENVTYNNIKKQFEYNGVEISLNNNTFFKDISWTLSYRPANEGFISFHDWHPDQTIQLDSHFMTIKENGIWKHNDNCQSFCNFYGKDYSFDISPIISNGQEINILNSFEYQLEAYIYKPNCLDRTHVLKENFDKAEVSNSEQHSGVLNLITKTNITSDDIYNYPKRVNNFTTDIICNKKENKYRFNGFKNIVKDRGEQSGLNKFIFKHHENGYLRSLDTLNLDNTKDTTVFRHSYHQIFLSKTISNNVQFLFKFLNSKATKSIR